MSNNIRVHCKCTEGYLGCPIWDLKKYIQLAENPAINIVDGKSIVKCPTEDSSDQDESLVCTSLTTALVTGDVAKLTYSVHANNLTGYLLNWASILNIFITEMDEMDENGTKNVEKQKSEASIQNQSNTDTLGSTETIGSNNQLNIISVTTQIQYKNEKEEWADIGPSNHIPLNKILNNDQKTIIIPLTGSVPLADLGNVGDASDKLNTLFRLEIIIENDSDDSIKNNKLVYGVFNNPISYRITAEKWKIRDSEVDVDANIGKSTCINYEQLIPVDTAKGKSHIEINNYVSLYEDPQNMPDLPFIKAACDSYTDVKLFSAVPSVTVIATIDQVNESRWTVNKEGKVIPSRICTRTAQYWANNGPNYGYGPCGCDNKLESSMGSSVSSKKKLEKSKKVVENLPNIPADNWPKVINDKGIFINNKNIITNTRDICTLLNRPDSCVCTTSVPLILNRLVQQYVTAVMNQSAGTYVPPHVQEVLYQTQDLLNEYNVLDCVELSGKDQPSAITFTTVLEKYNNGMLNESGPHCDDDEPDNNAEIVKLNSNSGITSDTIVQYTINLRKEYNVIRTPQVLFTINLGPGEDEKGGSSGGNNSNSSNSSNKKNSQFDPEDYKLSYEKQFNWELFINDKPLNPPVKGKCAIPANSATSGSIIIGTLTTDDLKIDDKVTIKLEWEREIYDIKYGFCQKYTPLSLDTNLRGEDGPLKLKDDAQLEYIEELADESKSQKNKSEIQSAIFETKVLYGDILETKSYVTENITGKWVNNLDENQGKGDKKRRDDKRDRENDNGDVNNSSYLKLVIPRDSNSINESRISEIFAVVDGQKIKINEKLISLFQELVINQNPIQLPFDAKYQLPIISKEATLSYLVQPNENVGKLTATTTVTNVTGSNEIDSSSTKTTLIRYLDQRMGRMVESASPRSARAEVRPSARTNQQLSNDTSNDKLDSVSQDNITANDKLDSVVQDNVITSTNEESSTIPTISTNSTNPFPEKPIQFKTVMNRPQNRPIINTNNSTRNPKGQPASQISNLTKPGRKMVNQVNNNLPAQRNIFPANNNLPAQRNVIGNNNPPGNVMSTNNLPPQRNVISNNNLPAQRNVIANNNLPAQRNMPTIAQQIEKQADGTTPPQKECKPCKEAAERAKRLEEERAAKSSNETPVVKKAIVKKK